MKWLVLFWYKGHRNVIPVYSLSSYFLWFLGMCVIQVKNHKPISHPLMTSLWVRLMRFCVPAHFSPECPTKFFLRRNENDVSGVSRFISLALHCQIFCFPCKCWIRAVFQYWLVVLQLNCNWRFRQIQTGWVYIRDLKTIPPCSCMIFQVFGF